MKRARIQPAIQRDRRPSNAAETFGEADLEAAVERSSLQSRTVYPPRSRHDSDIHELSTVPPDERPSRQNLPGSIQEAVLAVLDQIPRMVSAPPPARSVDSDER